MLQIDKQLRHTRISQNSRPDEQQQQRRVRRKHPAPEVQRYEFDESDDEKVEDDPVAWALASRAGIGSIFSRAY